MPKGNRKTREYMRQIRKQGSGNPIKTLRTSVSHGLSSSGGAVNPGIIGASVVSSIEHGKITKDFAIRHLKECCSGIPGIRGAHIAQIRGYINKKC